MDEIDSHISSVVRGGARNFFRGAQVGKVKLFSKNFFIGAAGEKFCILDS